MNEWYVYLFIILGSIASVCWIFDWKPFTFAGRWHLKDMFKIPDTGARPAEAETLKGKYQDMKPIRFPGCQISGIPGSIAYRRHHEPHHRKRHTRKRRVAR